MGYNPKSNFLVSDSLVGQMANGDIDDSVIEYAGENNLGVEIYVTETDFEDIDQRKRMYWLTEYLENNNVEVRGVHAPTSESLENMTSSEEEMRGYVEDLTEFISPEYITVHTHLYPEKEGEVREEAQEELIDRMARVVDSTDFDGKILMENSSFAIYGIEDYPEEGEIAKDQQGFPLLETPEDMRKFSEYIQEQEYGDRVGIVLDTNHADNPISSLDEGGDQIENIHLHDGVNLEEEDWRELAEEYFMEDGSLERDGIPEGDGSSLGHIPPGEGDRLPEGFKTALKRAGYSGNLTLEVEDSLISEDVVSEFDEEWT